MFSSTCPSCRGSGRVISEPCPSCKGEKYVERRDKVVVTFPAGIDGGQRVRVQGKGMPGHPGAEPGDLYVDVELEPDQDFERDGFDIGTRRKISFPDAALGGSLSVTLPDGTNLDVKYPAGVQPGAVLTTRGRGVPELGGQGRGDVHVLIEVAIPEKLSRKAKKLIEELREELGPS